MKQDRLWREFNSLPPELQKQAAKFISSLRKRNAPPRLRKNGKRTSLASEPFIGLWRDREDLQESSAWVREIRRREWTSRRA